MLWEDTSVPVVASDDDEDTVERFEEDSELDLDDGEDFSDEDFEDEDEEDEEDDDYSDYEDEFEEEEPHYRPEWR